MRISSEFKLIGQIRKWLAKQKTKSAVLGPGDDTAVLPSNKTYYELATTDCLVEDVHFSLKFFTPSQIGQKAIAANVSDIAAMGGSPKFALVSLLLPASTEADFVNEFCQGLITAANHYGLEIVGGNLSKNNKIVVDITILGAVKPQKLILRSGAKPGDLVLVSGNLGEAAAGLKLLIKCQRNIKKFKSLISHQLTPVARLKEAEAISQLKLATAMIDLSDGLSSDLIHVCEESQVGVKIWADRLPISEACQQAAKLLKTDVNQLALNGGEDYELCLTAKPENAAKLIKTVRQKTDTKLTIIGEILPGDTGRLVYFGNKRVSLTAKGWGHFKH